MGLKVILTHPTGTIDMRFLLSSDFALCSLLYGENKRENERRLMHLLAQHQKSVTCNERSRSVTHRRL